ncbi:hypothetical protein [Actinomadura sp. HBU206391]|uniref:hypothetical protein n=1 Tax=Actinomadura sp. HBU206391 TaxID=2731692 RepID=UPI00164F1405|nr:hypothetical protein [Actinomadura sp. HBU206391]MBC6458683.1 hypothetical protein [Actinomadura sp. HBU206391]
MKRRTLPALLVSVVTGALALNVALAPASHADPIEPDLVAESINDGGVYVASGAKLFADDAAKDRLRAQLETAKRPVYVAVLPAGSSLTPSQLYRIVKREGTFAVLSGNNLTASSSVMPAAQLRSALSGARRANGANPAGALISFVRLTNGTPKPPGSKVTPEPLITETPTEVTEEEPAPTDEATQAAPAKKDDGSKLPIIGGVAALVIVAAGGGFLLWRRRSRSDGAVG